MTDFEREQLIGVIGARWHTERNIFSSFSSQINQFLTAQAPGQPTNERTDGRTDLSNE